MQISGEKNDDIVKPKMKNEYHTKAKHKWIVTDKYAKRVPGLFKIEFEGTRMICLTSKCYFADNYTENEENIISKISCKGTNKNKNQMTWKRYYNALQGENDYVKKTGIRKEDGVVKTYSQVKLGLSAYYDTRRILEDNINTEVLY